MIMRGWVGDERVSRVSISSHGRKEDSEGVTRQSCVKNDYKDLSRYSGGNAWEKIKMGGSRLLKKCLQQSKLGVLVASDYGGGETWGVARRAEWRDVSRLYTNRHWWLSYHIWKDGRWKRGLAWDDSGFLLCGPHLFEMGQTGVRVKEDAESSLHVVRLRYLRNI